MSETRDITGPIMGALKEMGWMALRLNSGTAKKGKYYIKLCPAGTPDIVAFKAGEPVWWVETKKPKEQGGHTNREQIVSQSAFRERALALGHRHTQATSLDDVLEALR
jgi:hypothetical protein